MRIVLALLFACLLSAGIVDSLAITVGSKVITELQIDEDLRVAALLNGQPVNRDVEARRAAADRLVEQLLIQREIDLSHYPPPSDQDVSIFYSHVEETLGGPKVLRRLLSESSLSEEILRQHLKNQLATIRFIEVRFSPDITITEDEIENRYRAEIGALQAASPGANNPPLDAQEHARLSNALVEERTDAALNSWLAETRKQYNIVYLDPALR